MNKPFIDPVEVEMYRGSWARSRKPYNFLEASLISVALLVVGWVIIIGVWAVFN